MQIRAPEHKQPQVPAVFENYTKTLVWTKIFCYVFGKMKTETFESRVDGARGKLVSGTIDVYMGGAPSNFG